MGDADPTYDIHEKIAQLETELLQHELLIRRQKHVINSLKTMITQSPQKAPTSSVPTPAPQRILTEQRSVNVNVGGGLHGSTGRTVSTTAVNSVNRTNHNTTTAARSGNVNVGGGLHGSTGRPTATPTVSNRTNHSNGTGINTAVRSNPAKTPAAVTRPSSSMSSMRAPSGRPKKSDALHKVFMFCKSIPKFGSIEPVKKRRRSTEGEADMVVATTSKRSREGPGNGHSNGDAGEDYGDVPALLNSARAKLEYIHGSRSSLDQNQQQRVTAQSSSSNGGTGTGSAMRVVSRAQLGASSSSSDGPTKVRDTRILTSSSSSSSSSAIHTSSSLSASRPTTSVSARTPAAAPVRGSTAPPSVRTTSASAIAGSTTVQARTPAVVIARPGTTPAATASKSSSSYESPRLSGTPIKQPVLLATPVRSSASSQQQQESHRTAITSNHNLLSVGTSAHKGREVVDHLRSLVRAEDRLEAAKDLHANILTNPRRLQYLLDSAGGRDLFLSWLLRAMDALTAAAAASAVPSSSLGLASSASNKGKGNGMSAAEELTLTKLIEYSVLLLNQAYWDAKMVTDLKFDKTLKNLYRLYEFKTAAHHVTVVNIVKSIWPSYRIMRKQFEGKSKSTSSAQLIQ